MTRPKEVEKERNWKLSLYLSIVIGAGVLLEIVSLFHLDFSLSQLVPFFIFSLLAFLLELMPVYLQGGVALSISFTLVYAALLLFSPYFATSVAFLCMFFATIKSPYYASLFNASQYALSAFLSGQVFQMLGGYELSWQSLPFYGVAAVSILVFFVSNTFLVGGVISLSQGTPLRLFWREKNIREILFQYFALFPFSLLLYLVYSYVGYWGIILFFFPLMVARYSFKLFADTKKNHLQLLQALIAALDARDSYTAGHSSRVAELSLQIAEHLHLPPQKREALEYAAVLHDVGKLGIQDSILTKQGELSEDEHSLVCEHPEIGYKILGEVDFLQEAAQIVLAHHERMDGSGYPEGKKGEEIPIEARIVGAADVFDALTSDRPYRRAYSAEEALEIMENEEKGSFDPEVLQILRKIVEEKREKNVS
ncbi:MAG TPA: HD-GYP domain-containing protein [Candidatus Atribacteria bacterium]|nr:HD-GYP domain-containing protein [Candidatus Atribacteria bacterium]